MLLSGRVERKKGSGRKLKDRSREIEIIREKLENDPTLSTRKIGKEIGMSSTAVRRIIKNFLNVKVIRTKNEWFRVVE